MLMRGNDPHPGAGMQLEDTLGVAFSRTALRTAWKAHAEGKAFSYRDEGSDLFTNMIWKYVQGNHTLPDYPLSKIAPLIEDDVLMTARTDSHIQNHRLVDENTVPPCEEEGLKRLWKIRETTIKMVVAGSWHLKSMRCPFKTIEKIYTLLLGKNMLMSSPRPDMATFRLAERNIWKELAVFMLEDMTLEEAIEEILKDTMPIWKQVFFEKEKRPTPSVTPIESPQIVYVYTGGQGGKGKGKGWTNKGWSDYPWSKGKGWNQSQDYGSHQQCGKDQSSWSDGQQPSGKGQKKGKKGGWKNHQQGPKSTGGVETIYEAATLGTNLYKDGVKLSVFSRDWAKRLCRSYAANKCDGSACGENHMCPVIKDNGQVCGLSNHKPWECFHNKIK